MPSSEGEKNRLVEKGGSSELQTDLRNIGGAETSLLLCYSWCCVNRLLPLNYSAAYTTEPTVALINITNRCNFRFGIMNGIKIGNQRGLSLLGPWTGRWCLTHQILMKAAHHTMNRRYVARNELLEGRAGVRFARQIDPSKLSVYRKIWSQRISHTSMK